MDIPKYREGFPRVDIVQAKKATAGGSPVCRFFSTVREAAIGEVFILDWQGGRLSLAYCLLGPPHRRGNGTVWIDTILAGAPNASKQVREYFVCPLCEAGTAILVYKFEWACADCHQLSHRSKLIPPAVRRFEQSQVLRDLIAAGRRSRQRQSTLSEYQRKLKQLENRPARPFAVASVAHQEVITARWNTFEEVKGQLAHSDFEIQDGTIVPRQPYEFEKNQNPRKTNGNGQT